MLRQTQHEVKVNSIATKKSMSRQKVEKKCKNNVATKKFYVET